MILAGVDLETTGLDLSSLHVIEIGAALWDTDRRAPIALFSKFVRLPDGEKVPEQITELTGIRDEDLAKFGTDHARVFTQLEAFLGGAAHLVGHNCTDFDRPILCRDFRSMQHTFDSPILAKPWIDTSVDVPYPKHITTRKLTHLCAEHGFLNPFPHRAVFDVLSMLKVLDQYPLDQVLELAASPTLKVWAGVSFDEKEKAKARGYRWDSEQRIWTKNLKQCFLERERSECDFAVNVINENWRNEQDVPHGSGESQIADPAGCH